MTLKNTGSLALVPTSISTSSSFSETDNCVNASIAAGASCSIQVTFTPQAAGPLTGLMTIYANVYGGQLTVDLNGTGAISGVVTPDAINFELRRGGSWIHFDAAPGRGRQRQRGGNSYRQRFHYRSVRHRQQLLWHHQPCGEQRLPGEC